MMLAFWQVAKDLVKLGFAHGEDIKRETDGRATAADLRTAGERRNVLGWQEVKVRLPR
jgi:hypothetical protein